MGNPAADLDGPLRVIARVEKPRPAKEAASAIKDQVSSNP